MRRGRLGGERWVVGCGMGGVGVGDDFGKWLSDFKAQDNTEH